MTFEAATFQVNAAQSGPLSDKYTQVPRQLVNGSQVAGVARKDPQHRNLVIHDTTNACKMKSIVAGHCPDRTYGVGYSQPND